MTPIQQNIPEWALWMIAYVAVNVVLLAWARGSSEKGGSEVVILGLGLPILCIAIAWALGLLIVKGPKAFKKEPKDLSNVVKFRGKE